MTIGFLFWVLMVIWLVFGVYVRWGNPPNTPFPLSPVGDLLIFILLLLLGIHAFGWPIRT